MQGFFTKKETSSISRPTGRTQSCVTCGLYKNCQSPRMKVYGNFKKGILNISEAPAKEDDKANLPFQGKDGKFLQRTYKKLGIDLFEDCLNMNAVNCYTETVPTNFQIECCRRFVLKAIEEYKPKVIVLFGMSAVYSLIGYKWKKGMGKIQKWRGWTIPDQDFKAWICPVFDIDFVMDSDGAEETIWKNDLKQSISKIDMDILKYDIPEIEIIEDLSLLEEIESYEGQEVAVDFETTGKKLESQGHKIICCAVADTPNHAYSFMMPKTKTELTPLLNLLTNPLIKKIAANIKFETKWAKVKLRVDIEGWEHDTMLMAHLLDNRPGITSLKFQVLVNFGIYDYNSEIAPYLKAVDDKNGNAINRIEELLVLPDGKEKLLRYCGYDAVYEKRLADLQRINLLPF